MQRRPQRSYQPPFRPLLFPHSPSLPPRLAPPHPHPHPPRYHSLAPMYYRNAAAAIVVYDITNADSFEKARKWVDELRSQGSQGVVIALAGGPTLKNIDCLFVTDCYRYSWLIGLSAQSKVGALELKQGIRLRHTAPLLSASTPPAPPWNAPPPPCTLYTLHYNNR